MTKLGRRLIAAAKEAVLMAREHRQYEALVNWGMGQARTCLVCGDILLTKKDLRIHRANHSRTETLCEKTVTT